jgi:prepilin-type N-terminal cleavage/methylation domain-containing protein
VHCRHVARRSGFSLVELMVVMAVAMLLTALTMPAMQQLHENAQRVVCMSNLSQIGHGFIIWGGDHNDYLPEAQALNQNESPQNLMMARRTDGSWDGMGHLFEKQYCGVAECFYCPSHHGKHPFERYSNMWTEDAAPPTSIFTNYHYAGHMDWKNSGQRRTLLDGYSLVLATDGLRTATDFNHIQGMNMLRGDGSVHWRDDTEAIYEVLPKTEQEQITPEYMSLWDLVEQRR